MIYEEHYKLQKEYKQAKNNYDDILEKKAKIYFKTQPQAIDTTRESVQGGCSIDAFASYVQQLEKLDEELSQARNERDLKQYLLKKKELELKESKEILNKVYYYKFVERLKTKFLPSKTNYSRPQIYRFLEEIKKNINMRQNETKVGL